MRKTLLVTALAVFIILSANVVPFEGEAAYSKTFSDVSKNNPYYEIIHLMAEKRIISGYEDGTFKPGETLTRKHAAALINRVGSVEAINLTIPPKDIHKNRHSHYDAIKALINAGLINKDMKGDIQAAAPKDLPITHAYYNDLMQLINAGLLEVDTKGNINPNAPLTRGEMAKILAVVFELEGYLPPPKDVSNKYHEYVAELYAHDITTGFEDGTFKENGYLTRAHYAVFIYRSMGLGIQVPSNISMDSSNKEINNYIKSNALFKKGLVAHPIALNELYGFKKVIVETENILAGTDLKVTSILGSGISYQHDNWQYVDKRIGSQVTYVGGYQNDMHSIRFDYKLPDSQKVVKRILTTVFAKDFDTVELGRLIDEKVAEAIATEDAEFSNIENIELGNYKIRFGVERWRNGEVNHFWMHIEK